MDLTSLPVEGSNGINRHKTAKGERFLILSASLFLTEEMENFFCKIKYKDQLFERVQFPIHQINGEKVSGRRERRKWMRKEGETCEISVTLESSQRYQCLSKDLSPSPA
jgi:hypothetical protein